MYSCYQLITIFAEKKPNENSKYQFKLEYKVVIEWRWRERNGTKKRNLIKILELFKGTPNGNGWEL